MGETHETETLPPEMTPAAAEKTVTTRKSRRNGLWNIFEGVDNTVLEKLGLSEEVVHQIVTEADNTVSQHLATHMDKDYEDDDDNAVNFVTDCTSGSRSGTAGCHCRKARILRSFSATVGEEVKAAQQNRHRRNAVGNLFDVLTPSQQLLLAEHLQEQLERLHCLCGGPQEDAGEVMKSAPPAAATTKNHHEADSNINSNINSNNSSSGGIFLALTDFSSTSSSSLSSSSSSQPGPATSSVASSSPKEEVVCH